MGFSRPLNERTLTHHAARVSIPTYDRASLRRGVVHIGVGSFHRSHQAAYFDELARRGLGDGWALTGVGLAGHKRIDEVMRDPELARYARRLMTDEIAPLLPPVHADLEAYGETLRERFANTAVADRLSRLRRNGSTKVPAHLLSSIREATALSRPHRLLTLGVSAWCRCLRDGSARDDPHGQRLQALALAGGNDPRPLLADEATFGSLGRCPRFAAAVERDLHDLGDAPGDAAAVAAARTESALAV